MKRLSGVILLVFALAACSYATQEQSSLAALLEMRAQASGAIDTVLNLLEDLRKASLNERAEIEARNKTQEAEGTKLVAELTRILNINEKNYQDAVAHREYIEKEVADTEAHLIWIEKRLAEIARKLKELKTQRCRANALFVEAIKQHNDALKAIKILEAEIQRLHAAGELTEIQSLTDKFKAYEHLFEKETINSFLELANNKGVDDITGQVDNKRGALHLEGPKTNPGQRNLKGTLVEKVLKMLVELAEHLKESMKDLTQHEIQADYDYAEFKASSAVENVTLREDHKRKVKYLAKLEIDVEVAREAEERTLGLRDEAQINVDSAVMDLDGKREFYAQEAARVKEDISTVEQVIAIFKAKVSSIQDVLKTRVDEAYEGKKMTHVDRSAEDWAATNKGNLLGNKKH